MKKILLSTITLLFGCISYAQVPVLYYDFEVNSSRNSDHEVTPELAINTGNSGFSRSNSVIITQTVGAGALYSGDNGKAMMSDKWPTSSTNPGGAATQYLQFAANTTGCSGLSLMLDISRNSSGPKSMGISYSLDGNTFTPITTIAPSTNFVTTTVSLPAAVDNQSQVVFRLYGFNATNIQGALIIDNAQLRAMTISGIKTLFDFQAMGVCLASGKSYKPRFTDLSISGAGTVVYLNSGLPYTGTLSVGPGATLSVGTQGAVSDTTGASADAKVSGGNLVLQDGSTLQLSSTDSKSALKATLGIATLKLNPLATIEYIGSAPQYQDAETLTNVIVSNANGVVQNGDVVISGNLTLKNGTMTAGANKLTIKGNINKTSGVIDASNAEVIFDGTAAQSVAAGAFTGPVKKLNINNASGVSFDTDATITEAINLTSGKLNIGTKKLTIRGALSRNGDTELGTIDAQNGSLEFDGTLAQAIPAGALQNNKVKNLRISNKHVDGVSLNGKMDVSGVLDFGAVNNGKLKSNGNLTLKSDATGTARVADLTNGGVNTGNTVEGLVTVERYFANNGRRYRLITPGVTTTTSIRANWQEGVNNTSVGENINPVPGYGTHITGSGGAANGFDATQANNASLFSFNQSTNAWVAVTNTATTTLSANKPYLIFLRGDRSVNLTLPGASSVHPGSATILRATGTLANGDQNANGLGSNGAFSLISNPYASPVSWTKVHGNNSSKFEEYYTYWDPKVGPRGSYVTVATSGLKSHATVAATTEIQSGQSFFVKTKAGVSAPSLSIREQDKSTNSNISVMRTTNKVEQLGISLFYTDANNQRIVADGVTAAYGNQYSAAVDAKDALQMAGWDEDVAIVREGKALSIETRPLITANDTIFLSMTRLKVQSYEWQFDAANFNAPGLAAYLVDNFTTKETLISTTGSTVVPFAITSNPASAAANRFLVVFKTGATLPVTYTAVKAAENAGAIKVEWNTASEGGISRYEVEKSADAVNFSTIATAAAKGGVSNNYTVTDRSPLKGNNYYRIKAVELNGDVKYSQVVTVKTETKQESVTAYPNPVTGTAVFVQLSNLEKGLYTVCLVNSIGVTVKSEIIRHTGNSTTESFTLGQDLPKGVYLLQVKGVGVEKTISLVRN